MSDFVVHKGRKEPESFARHYKAEVEEVEHHEGKRATVKLKDGSSGFGSCLGCGDAPCITKDESELALFGSLDSYPGDPSLDVCPTKAIQWDHVTNTPVINNDSCIGCGLCISRCPYGALNLVDGLTAKVQTTDSDNLLVKSAKKGPHPEVKHRGQIASQKAPAAANIPQFISTLDEAKTNLLVRNLLNEVGLNARTRRRGDMNMRIDAVGFSRAERPFVAEIEMGQGVLDTPRALLEDVAVLHSRYGFDVDSIDPISIILSFPSQRSEYYQVIRDIEKVLGLRCRSITIGALVTLLWHFAKIDDFSGDIFTIGEGVIDISDCLGIDGKQLIEPYPGAFKSSK